MQVEAWGRCFLELMLCLPAAMLCLAPVRDRLRVNTCAFVLAETCAVVLFSAVGAVIVMLARCPENALLLPAMLIFFLLYRRLVEVELLHELFIFLVASAVMAFCAVFTDVLLARVELASADDGPTWAAAGMQFGLGVLLTALLFPMMDRHVGWLIRSFSQKPAWRIVWLMPMAHLAMFIAMQPMDYNTVLVNRIQALGAAVLLFLLGLMVFLIELFYRIARSVTDGAALREENHFLAAQASQYAALSNYIQETRRLRHDFRQHLRVLSGLASKGDLAELNAYLRDVSGQEQEQMHFIFANPALNALAGYYEDCARTQGVTMEWNVSLPRTLGLTDAEMCVLLGNLLENALDGAGTVPEGRRQVRVICRVNGEMCCIIVENSYDGRVNREQGRLLSTKHEGGGYGLSSVRTLVNRCHGSMDVDTEDGIFRVSLLLNLPAEGNSA